MNLDRALLRQGVVFCAITVLVLLSAFLPRASAQTELFVAVVLIALLGVPHGALDSLFGARLYGLHGATRWSLFVVAYVGLAALVIAFWWWLPVTFLAAFLIVSVLHFSGDLRPTSHWISRFFYGGAIIVLPHFWHADEVLRLFQFLLGSDTNDASLRQISNGLTSAATPWLFAFVACALFEARRSAMTTMEMLALTALAVIAPPLIAFTLFFCAMHGARHVIRTLHYAGEGATKTLWISAGLAVKAVLTVGLVAFFYFENTPVDTRLLQIIFVGLAALTVPHMALVERVRFSGWK